MTAGKTFPLCLLQTLMSKSRTELLELYHTKRYQPLSAFPSTPVWRLALRAVVYMQCHALRLCERLQATEDYIAAA